MAETPKPKRVVKSPETFRERAIKASAVSDQPKRRSLRSLLAKVFRPPVRAVGAIFSVPPLSWLKRPLRLIGLVIFPRYFRNSWKELQQVSWPNLRESLRLTYAVLAFAIVFGISIAVVDYGLDRVFKHILLK